MRNRFNEMQLGECESICECIKDESNGKINLIIRQFPINKLKSDIFSRKVSNHMVRGGKTFPIKFFPIKN